jgi:uncharacterized protein YigE (DUF2233 family)
MKLIITKKKILISIIFILLIIFGVLIYKQTVKNNQNLSDEVYEFSSINFNNVTFDTVKIEPKNRDLIKFFYKDENNQNFKNIKSLNNWLVNQEIQLIFATNGGIFSKNYIPMGLYIENGKKISEINSEDGEGNFYLKPNGVFIIQKDKSSIIETSKYKDSSNILFAIQSGPLLILNNEINPLFNKNSRNKYVRNGVGINPNEDIIFAISNKPVTFYEFASFFKENLGCSNALYLDGAISEMYIPKYRENTKEDFSVIIGIVK